MTDKQKQFVNDLLPACLAGSQLGEERPEWKLAWLNQYSHTVHQQDSIVPGPLSSPAGASGRRGAKRPWTSGASAQRGSAAGAEDGGDDVPQDPEGSTPKRTKADSRPTKSAQGGSVAAAAPAKGAALGKGAAATGKAKGAAAATKGAAAATKGAAAATKGAAAPAKGAAAVGKGTGRHALIPSMPMGSPSKPTRKRPTPISTAGSPAEGDLSELGGPATSPPSNLPAKRPREQPADALHATITLRTPVLTKLEQARTAQDLQRANERAAEQRDKRIAFDAFKLAADAFHSDKKEVQKAAWDLILAEGETWKTVSAFGKQIGIVSLFDHVIHTFVASPTLTGPACSCFCFRFSSYTWARQMRRGAQL